MLPVWILLLNEDERNKLEWLFNDFGKQMRAIAARFLKTQEDIEDAVSDSFLKIADNMYMLEGLSIDDVHAFCFVVTRNAAIDIRRKNTKRNTVFTELKEEITPAPLDIFEQYERKEIEQYLTKLPEEQKEALWLRYHIGIKVEEIARIQGVKPITVYKRCDNGKAKVRAMMKADEKHANKV